MDYRTAARPARRTLIVRNERLRTVLVNGIGGSVVSVVALVCVFLVLRNPFNPVFLAFSFTSTAASIRAIRRIRHARAITEITIDGARALVVRSDGSTHELALDDFHYTDVETVTSRNPREGHTYRARIRLKDGNGIYVDTVGTRDELHQMAIADSVGRFLRTD